MQIFEVTFVDLKTEEERTEDIEVLTCYEQDAWQEVANIACDKVRVNEIVANIALLATGEAET